MITSQLGLSAAKASFTSFAKARPSCRFRFIFQLPATIFFLIFLFFFKSVYSLLRFLCFFIHLVHAHRRSAKVSKNSGNTNQSTILVMRVVTLVGSILPMLSLFSGAFSVSCLGKALWLHLLITTPSLMSISPGLLLIIVFSVVPSVM